MRPSSGAFYLPKFVALYVKILYRVWTRWPYMAETCSDEEGWLENKSCIWDGNICETNKIYTSATHYTTLQFPVTKVNRVIINAGDSDMYPFSTGHALLLFA